MTHVFLDVLNIAVNGQCRNSEVEERKERRLEVKSK